MDIDYKAAGSTGDALKILEHYNPKILVADIMLANEDAKPIVEYFKRSCPNSKVVLITSLPGITARSVANELKADGLLLKPFDLSELEEVVKKYVS